jgi:hypothetical protein
MTGPKSIQNAPARGAEGARTGEKLPGSQQSRGASTSMSGRRGPGRPKGSVNKPKSLIPAEIADEMLLKMRGMLPPEHFEYMKSVIRDGKAISTKNELDVLVLLLARNLYPALIMEQFTTEESNDVDDFFNDGGAEPKNEEKKLKMPVFRKDVTERLKVLQGLLSLRNQVEKRDSDSTDEDKPLLKIVGGRGFDASRVRLLVGLERTALAGNPDGTGFETYDLGALPDQVSERSIVLSPSEQVPADRVLDGDRG